MTCNQCQPDLSAYVDGELPVARRAELDSHITACAACQRRLAELRRVAAGLHALPQQSPPPGFLREVQAKLAQPLPRRNWWPVPLGAVAAVAALLAVTVLLRPPPTLTPAGQMADYEAPAEKAKMADLPTPAVSAPAVSGAAGGANEERADDDRLQPADALGKFQGKTPPVVMTRESAAKVQESVRALAGSVVSRDEAGGVVVELPAKNEARFRQQLGAEAKDEWRELTNEFDRVVLQIQIVPPAAEPSDR